VKDEEKALNEQSARAINELADDATAAASDVTLTSDVVDQQLPTEQKVPNQTSSAETNPVGEPAHPDDSPLDVRKRISRLEEPLSQTATVCIDITGPFPVRQENKDATPELQDDKTDQNETAEGQKTHEEENLTDDIADSGKTYTGKSQQETPEPDEKISESELQSDKRESAQSTIDEVMQANADAELETEVGRIEVPESEDDDCDSTSVFNTCDEWLESLQGSGRMSDQAASLQMLNEDNTDRIAPFAEPDDIDEPPMAPRSREPKREKLKPIPAAMLGYSCGDSLKYSDGRKSAKFRVRGVDGKSGDRPTSSHGVASVSIQPPRLSKRRPQSVVSRPLSGRIPQQAGPVPPISKGLPRTTHVPSLTSHTFNRSYDSPATKCSVSTQSNQRARAVKPNIKMGRKPAWK